MTIESESLSYSGQPVKLLPAICMCDYGDLLNYSNLFMALWWIANEILSANNKF